MENWTDWFASLPAIESDYLSRGLRSLMIIIVLWGFYRLINRVVTQRTTDVNTRYSWKTGTRYTFVLLSAFLVGRLWVQGLSTIFTVLGLISAALTVTQKEALMNLTGWGVIFWRNLFVLGDRIQIGVHQGDVVGMGPFYFTLMEIGNWVSGDQSTGRIVNVPNSLVWTTPVANYTLDFPFIWNEISFNLTPESDWEQARNILKEIGNKHTIDVNPKAQSAWKHTKEKNIIVTTFTPIVYMRHRSEKPSGYVVILRYLCEPKKRRDREQAIIDDVLKTFQISQNINIRWE
ncbi:MAG: mechanosensitive ion channel [SAR324 cluster bacterium]|nr:mechanosensitive ion channel [SAR324 cluster bacterium]